MHSTPWGQQHAQVGGRKNDTGGNNDVDIERVALETYGKAMIGWQDQATMELHAPRTSWHVLHLHVHMHALQMHASADDHLVLELGCVSGMHGDCRAVHMQLPHNAAAADQLRLAGCIRAADLAQPQQANEDVLQGISE